jgi:hypothetical protein
MSPPTYFDKIRAESERRWGQLEADPVLAGPWHQLFRQVQSPRHVLSELLQNADDAGARRTWVRIEGDSFVFEHDGADFTEDQFASLCRFGFSNKRNLHTIGFRGVGFKSTFSLGDRVEVSTPTLAIAFDKTHFTEPVWSNGGEKPKRTVIRVAIADRNRRAQLEKNLAEWSANPSALLFFKSIQELTIDGQTVRKKILRDGPVSDSWWIRLIGATHTEELLLVRSKAESFPEEAIDEIRAERNVDDLHLPPAEIEIVLGLDGTQRLFVVLPTGAEIPLPFSCNAPFIQDPARYAIKDPATSPTNRWLLARAGRLAGETLRAWVGNKSLPLADRATGYDLLPSDTVFDSDLSGACGEEISRNLLESIEGRPIALSTEGVMATPGNCLAVPIALHDVWNSAELIRVFGAGQANLLAREVAAKALQFLVKQEWVSSVDTDGAIIRLGTIPSPPRPETWQQVRMLWNFVQDEVRFDWNYDKRRGLRIVPVTGERELHAARDVIRLSSRREAISEADWKFITDHARAIDSGWVESLAAKSARKGARSGQSQPEAAVTLLQGLALHEPSGVDRIAAKAAERIFKPGVTVTSCVRITQIMAALGAKVPDSFKYVTKDLHLRDVNHGIVSDDSGEVEEVVPPLWAEEHVLHGNYTAQFVSCKREAWEAWVRSETSGISIAPPIRKRSYQLWSRASVEDLAKNRGAQKPPEYHYKRDDFTVEDFSFDRDLINHWAKAGESQPELLSRVLEMVLVGPKHGWKSMVEAEIRHNGSQYYKTLACGFIPAEWIVNFRSVQCLPDTQGTLRFPAELLLRTPDTEPLLGIEPFVRADLDTEGTKPLLRLLGVGDTPLGSDRILDRLRAHMSMPDPLAFVADITRLYQAVDRVVSRCTPEHLKILTDTFAEESLILTESLEWVTSGETSIFADDDAASTTIHSAARRLALWPRLGVPERPALEQTVAWLETLESGSKIEGASSKRIRAALQREPVRIWQTCGHWLSLDSTWEPISRLQYRLTMQGLMRWGELAPFIKKRTANLQMLTADALLLPPFFELRDLSDAVDLRVTKSANDESRSAAVPEWLREIAVHVSRIKLPSEPETLRVRGVAQRLARTAWRPVSQLEVTPYIDGMPAGESSRPKAFWGGTELCVSVLSPARLHKEIVDELTRAFAHSTLAGAISACVDRSVEFVREYFSSEFEIDPNQPLPGFEGDTRESPEPQASPVSVSSDGETAPEEEYDSNEDEEPEPDESEEETETGAEQPSTPQRNAPSPNSTLIGRYASRRGFRWDRRSRQYLHVDGRRIGKSSSPFNWEERDSDGEPLARFWVTDQNIATGVEVAADLWLLLKDAPNVSSLVTVGNDHEPCVLSGEELLAFQQAGQIKLYPSRYRIVQSD